MDSVLLGKLIRQRRKEKGLTQEKLAKMANLSRQTLSGIENGKLGSIRFVIIVNLLRMLGYDLCIKPFNPFENKDDDVTA